MPGMGYSDFLGVTEATALFVTHPKIQTSVRFLSDFSNIFHFANFLIFAKKRKKWSCSSFELMIILPTTCLGMGFLEC